ncbi:EAL domain-containing protein [Solirubrobacter ginsenosidimutans]|uniref:EAL domain-containing protein n=1 Tax=Solirubrobacter ginsenosidimutans TaxID=490573 RepID=A0A9X3MSC9_9ACTN|nr:EAL domain-containing protein [Solirubrobacter ginsenosidimutans]MDA0161021.1 EAL domain-containing protein [Solirubrobacter ginsenosidimutans]
MRLRALSDPEEIAMRARDVVIGGVLAIATAVAIVAYLLQSERSAHPLLLGAVCITWSVASCGMFAIPRQRIAASRWREPFFLGWSFMVAFSLASGVVLEDRSNTPLMLGFILPLIFAAISYPVVSTAIVGSLVLVFAAAAAVLTGQSSADMTFQLAALAFAAVMGIWQAYGRERRASQLAAEHFRAQQYLDVAGTMIVVMDAHGVIERVNNRTCEVLGYSEEELHGQDWFEIAVPDDFRATARENYRLGLAGTPNHDDDPAKPFVTRAGERRYVTWSGRLVRTRSGRGMLIAGEDITEKRAAQARVSHMAYHDALTGLANRAKLEEHLALALARARRQDRSVAVLYIDLDRFKLVNDTLGHAAGDELLRQVATRLGARTRSSDLLARHGGDEFMLLLSDLDGDARAIADHVAHELMATLEQPFTLQGHEFEIAASIGIAIHPDDGADMSDVLKHADAALYDAKRDGRGTVRFATPSEQVAAAGQLTLTARLRRALAREEFELHYQPVFNVATREVVAVEALLRWNDPDRGMVPPGEFIPGAEDSGLIEPIGDWVVDAVIAQAARWRDRGLRPDIAFNVSPRQLRSDGFADRLLARMADADATQFIAEITESAAMADPEHTVPLLGRLAAAGLRLAIDDFGADFSSLARLRDLPVHELKIDRSFLRDVPGDGRSAAIVTAIVRLAQALELVAVAEGVEHADQLDFLAKHDCALVQGFHLARPMPADLVTPLLQPSLARR